MNPVADTVRASLVEGGFIIVEQDEGRPWGAFFRIADEQASRFVAKYFKGVAMPPSAHGAGLSPKILLVAPRARLSWQYHDRRAELWRAITPVAVKTGLDDLEPTAIQPLKAGETISVPQGTRHRLIGLDEWGIVAEIWIHTTRQQPSDEADNHRLDDDYKRV